VESINSLTVALTGGASGFLGMSGLIKSAQRISEFLRILEPLMSLSGIKEFPGTGINVGD